MNHVADRSTDHVTDGSRAAAPGVIARNVTGLPA